MRPASPCTGCGIPTRVLPIDGAPRRHVPTGLTTCSPAATR